MKKIVLGILAHVDAGKTTLAEALLYQSHSIKQIGRVDHGDSFLDHHGLEKERGITIFSKNARFTWKDIDFALIDTPGHTDFSSEMERTLAVLDYAILVVSGVEGIQSHTLRLWHLFEQYQIPVFIFINKMDQINSDKIMVLEQLKQQLDENCIQVQEELESSWQEEVSYASEELFDAYIKHNSLSLSILANAIKKRDIFPCYFGSALKLEGIENLLEGLHRFILIPKEEKDFGGRVYKISRDDQGNRLTHFKLTGGRLKIKDLIDDEKINQIRLYSGSHFELVDAVDQGEICVLPGLKKTIAGQRLGIEKAQKGKITEAMMTYQIQVEEGVDKKQLYLKLRQLEEEDPQLHLVWKEESQQIQIQLMGDMQIEVVASLIQERFLEKVSFIQGSIQYKETIEQQVLGVGHFEPLRHYAEVVLLLEPLPRGSGIEIESCCREEDLALHWQKLILTHLTETIHPGVLIGAPITDMKITLVGGKAHLKHTEGGDFREATYRAVRQGLMMANSVLLEPFFPFQLQIPKEHIGRAMADFVQMKATFQTPEIKDEWATLTGLVPAITSREYQTVLRGYSQGKGKLTLFPATYEQCLDVDQAFEENNENVRAESIRPSSSIFCAHGSGVMVPWNQVYEHMHVENKWVFAKGKQENQNNQEINETNETNEANEAEPPKRRTELGSSLKNDQELEAIFQREFGDLYRRKTGLTGNLGYEKKKYKVKDTTEHQLTKEEEKVLEHHPHALNHKDKEVYLLVDGYNIIYDWPELKELAEFHLDSARGRLMDILCNYQGYTGETVILVFDAYKVKGNPGSVTNYHNIHVVYTKQAETADLYIEKASHTLGQKHKVVVATSDALEQLIVMGQGSIRMSARGLKEEIQRIEQLIREKYDYFK